MTPSITLQTVVILGAVATSAARSERFSQRFGRDPFNPRLLKPIGRAAKNAMTSTSRGMLIQLPAHSRDGKPAFQAGVATAFLVGGDFEITVGYELVQLEKPQKGYGAGVVMRLVRREPSRGHVGFGRSLQRNGQHVYSTLLRTYKGDEAQDDRKFFPTDVKRGQLRLQRTGETLHFLVAEGDSDEFRELRKAVLGTEPVESVHIVADTGGATEPMRVRLTEFSIRADELPIGLPQKPERHFWQMWAFWAVVGLIILISSGTWWWRQRMS